MLFRSPNKRIHGLSFSVRTAAVSLVARTEVGKGFPLGVPPGLGVSGAQADAVGKSRADGISSPGARKPALVGMEVRPQASGATIKPYSFRCTSSAGVPGEARIKRPGKLLCRLNPKRREDPEGARGTSPSRPGLLPGWPSWACSKEAA